MTQKPTNAVPIQKQKETIDDHPIQKNEENKQKSLQKIENLHYEDNTNVDEHAVSKMVTEQLTSEGKSTDANKNLFVYFDHKENGYYVVRYYEIVDEGQSTTHSVTLGWYAEDLINNKVFDITTNPTITNTPIK